MDATELRPLALGELLDRTFRLYRNHFWLFVGIMAIPSALSVPFTAIMFSFQTRTIIGGRPAPTFVAGSLIFLAIFVFFFWIAYAMAIGATTFAVSDAYLGNKVSVRGSYGRVKGNIGRIIGVVLLAWLRVIGMFALMGVGLALVLAAAFGAMSVVRGGPLQAVAGIAVGIVAVLAYMAWLVLWLAWSLRYAVCIPALLLENLGVRAALRRSIHLTKGRRWQLLVAIILCTMIAYVGVIVFQGPFFLTMMFSIRMGQIPEWLSYVLAVSGAIGGAITGPVLLIVLVLCYYDTRVRKEAFDLQFMMAALEAPAPPPEIPSAL